MRGLIRLLLAGAALVVPVAFASGASAASVPYHDPAAQGYIGLCNAAGQQVTSGSTTAVPFAWRAVSSQAAVAPYNNSYRTAILLAYQPLNGLTPGEWSGEELTASSRYTNPAHPMVAATTGDLSMATFMGDYPTHWDGYVQLRIYLGTENAPVYSLHYPVLDIKVTGTTWRALDGGTVNCHSGTSESIESIVLHSTGTATDSTTTTIGVALKSSSSPSSPWPWIVGVAVVALAVLALLIRRFRSTSNEHPVTPIKKGNSQ